MSEFRSIEIDFDIHRVIENERRSFAERPNDALRRLLGLAERVPEPAGPPSPIPAGRQWSAEGVTLPSGTEVRMSYNKVEHTGRIADGRWHVEGKIYDSPSGAASDVGRTKSGGKTRLDGWNYWEARKPGETGWTAISALRPQPSEEELNRILGLK